LSNKINKNTELLLNSIKELSQQPEGRAAEHATNCRS
jgi:hypothetical protein